MDSNNEPEREADPATTAEELSPQTADVTNCEATELPIYHSAATHTSSTTASCPSTAAHGSGVQPYVSFDSSSGPFLSSSFSTTSRYQGRFASTKKFWRRHISLAVPHVKCRDHLGMLTALHFAFLAHLGEPNSGTTANERTFLAWIRTSIALSILGVIIAQLFRLQNAPSPTRAIDLYALAIPLSCICQGAALITALIGGHRYWRQQSAMSRGQAISSGWEFWLMIGISGLVSGSPLIL